KSINGGPGEIGPEWRRAGSDRRFPVRRAPPRRALLRPLGDAAPWAARRAALEARRVARSPPARRGAARGGGGRPARPIGPPPRPHLDRPRHFRAARRGPAAA